MVFYLLNSGISGSNLTQDMNIRPLFVFPPVNVRQLFCDHALHYPEVLPLV